MSTIEIQCSECGVMFTHMPYHFTGMTTENLCRECYERFLIDEETYAQQHSEPSADDLAAQLAAAEKRIASLEASAKLYGASLDTLIQDDTYRANDLEDMAYKLGRYGATTASRQEDMATYIQGVIRRLKGTQS